MITERRIELNPIEIAPILAAIPSYHEFQTGAELRAGSKQLIKDYPTLVASGFLHLDENFGSSTEGRPIELMTVGKGKKKAMWMGTPHPNEAVGTLAIDFLSKYLCEHPEVTEQLDTTFVFIKTADPDGFALNESWMKGEMDPLKYALGFYRPPYGEEFEWGFPIDYKNLHFREDQASSESKMLKEAFDRYEPIFYYALHNYGFGKSFFSIYPPKKELFPAIQQLIKSQDLILHTGSPEMVFQEKYTDGIYERLRAKKQYDYLLQLRSEDPMNQILGGSTALEYLQNINSQAVSLSPEISYFEADMLKDNTPSGISRSDALLTKADEIQKIVTFMAEQFNALRDKLPESRLKYAVAKRIEIMTNNIANIRAEVIKPEYKEEATNAEVYEYIQTASFHEAIQLGQVYRLALQAGEIGRAEEIKAYIEDIINGINELSPIRVIPIQKLVAIQVGAGLTAQQYMANAA